MLIEKSQVQNCVYYMILFLQNEKKDKSNEW